MSNPRSSRLVVFAVLVCLSSRQAGAEDVPLCHGRHGDVLLEVRPANAQPWLVGEPRPFKLTIKNVGAGALMVPGDADLKMACVVALRAFIPAEARKGRDYGGPVGGLVLPSRGFQQLRPGESLEHVLSVTVAMPIEYEVEFRFANYTSRQLTAGRAGFEDKDIPGVWKGKIDCGFEAAVTRDIPAHRRALNQAFLDLAAKGVGSKEALAAFAAAAQRDDWISVQLCLHILGDPRLQEAYPTVFQRLIALADKGLVALDFDRFMNLAQREAAWKDAPLPMVEFLLQVAEPNKSIYVLKREALFVPTWPQRKVAFKQLDDWSKGLGDEAPLGPLLKAAEDAVEGLRPKMKERQREEQNRRSKLPPPFALLESQHSGHRAKFTPEPARHV